MLETQARKKERKLERITMQPMVMNVQKTLTRVNNIFQAILCTMTIVDTQLAGMDTLFQQNNYQIIPCIIHTRKMEVKKIPKMRKTRWELYHYKTATLYMHNPINWQELQMSIKMTPPRVKLKMCMLKLTKRRKPEHNFSNVGMNAYDIVNFLCFLNMTFAVIWLKYCRYVIITLFNQSIFIALSISDGNERMCIFCVLSWIVNAVQRSRCLFLYPDISQFMFFHTE